MKIKERIAKPRLAAYIISCIIPLFAIVFGIFLLLNNTILNTSFLVVMIILPIVTAALLFWTIFSKMRTSAKIVVAILILLVFAVMFLFGFGFGHFESLRHYEANDARQQFEENVHWTTLANLNEIGQPVTIEYIDYFSSGFLIFTNDVDVLICQYTPVEYEIQKASLEEKYIFQTEAMTAYGYNCNPTTKIDNYLFQALAISGTYGNAIDYPKRMAFIATNDETQEIVYLSTRDDDLDYLDSLEGFLKVDCGWKHIR